MSTQSEYALEAALIAQLNGMEYANVMIDDEVAMLANLKRQLENHNKDIRLTAFSTTSTQVACLTALKSFVINTH